jgi:formiminoglutamase
MSNDLNSQSQKRFLESIGSVFNTTEDLKNDLIFLCSSTDVGVERNGGRNGARFAPKSLITHFKKLNLNNKWRGQRISCIEVSDEVLERDNFENAQKVESEKIFKYLNPTQSTICHIGGGHDHILPLLIAVGKTFKKIIVLNIDAHADTRTDQHHHSGNPFRKFAQSYSGFFELYQIGLQEFANSSSTLSSMGNTQMEILWRSELNNEQSLSAFFNSISSDSDTALIFSLDCDVLAGYEVPGVSAVNGFGISTRDLREIWKQFKSLKMYHRPIIGIYELNPVFDTLSMQSIRTISNFLYEIL